MLDVLYIVVIIAFFALMVGLVRLCERIVGKDDAIDLADESDDRDDWDDWDDLDDWDDASEAGGTDDSDRSGNTDDPTTATAPTPEEVPA